MRLEGFRWLVRNKLAGMPHPGERPETFARLRAEGIGAVVTLTARPLPRNLLEEHDLEYLHLPIEEFKPPEPSQIRGFVDFCERNLLGGRAVLVHCLAGIGRTGTMLACYLVWRGTEPQEAIDFVRRCRQGSIETLGQERAVFDFAVRLAHDPDLGREKRKP